MAQEKARRYSTFSLIASCSGVLEAIVAKGRPARKSPRKCRACIGSRMFVLAAGEPMMSFPLLRLFSHAPRMGKSSKLHAACEIRSQGERGSPSQSDTSIQQLACHSGISPQARTPGLNKKKLNKKVSASLPPSNLPLRKCCPLRKLLGSNG